MWATATEMARVQATPTPPVAVPDGSGTGRSLPPSLLIVAAVSSLSATVLSLTSIYTHLKDYRKPNLQRFVVRLILIVPIFATSSLIGLFSLPAAFLIDLVRDLYEAFAIYCFFELLVAYLGGERSVLVLMIGRQPVQHPWPFRIFLREMDMSDPYTFLAIKRGILQYVQIKPILALATVLLKAFGKYEEGEFAADNGYTYVSSIYNISITLSLYCLALFWSALSSELEPFRPTAKFLTVKGVVFATFWQGWAISVLVASGAIRHIGPITDPSFLGLGLQDLLLTLEMPMFALGHMYAFSSQDYVDSWATHQARLPITYALRDALGGRDVLEDSLTTIRGTGYGYQTFEPSQGAVHQGVARSRRLHAGLRYTAGGKGKYFLPARAPQAAGAWAAEGTRIQGPLSAARRWLEEHRRKEEGFAPLTDEEEAGVIHTNPESEDTDERDGKAAKRRRAEAAARRVGHGLEAGLHFFSEHEHPDEVEGVPLGFSTPHGSEENLYAKARGLEHGDYAFPTIACVPEAKKKQRIQEEEEWLLGSRASKASQDGSLRSKERRKKVEGWFESMRGVLHGEESDDDGNDGDREGRKSHGRKDLNAETSDNEQGQSEQHSRKRRSRSKGSSNKRPKNQHRESEDADSPGAAPSKGVWGAWADSPAKKSEEAKKQTDNKASGDERHTKAAAADDSLASETTAAEDGDETIDSEAGAVDLIVSDHLEEQRKRDTERRRGDPALRTDPGGKRIFRRVWSGGSGRIEKVKKNRSSSHLKAGDEAAIEGSKQGSKPVEQGHKIDRETVQASDRQGPEGKKREEIVTEATRSGPTGDQEGMLSIAVEAPGAARSSTASPATSDSSEQSQEGDERHHRTAISHSRGIEPGIEKDHDDARDGPSDFDQSRRDRDPGRELSKGNEGPKSSGTRDKNSGGPQVNHMPVYQKHDDWQWGDHRVSEVDNETNPWA